MVSVVMEFSHLPDISLEGPVILETSFVNLYCMLRGINQNHKM